MLDGIINRRDFLQVGAVGLAGSLLASPSSASPRAPAQPASARSVILLWLAGGVTHIDSFDPKPDAPAEIRGTLNTIQTDMPGVRFTEVMPQLARQMRHLALI